MIEYQSGFFKTHTKYEGRGYSYLAEPDNTLVKGYYEYPPSFRFALEHFDDLDHTAFQFTADEATLHQSAVETLERDVLPEDTVHFTGPDDLYLREYQVRGIRFLLAQKRVLLSDDLGLGKTCQALIAAESAAQGAPILILAKSALMDQIASEVLRWTRLQPIILRSGKKRESDFLSLREFGQNLVVITNWEALSTFSPKTIIKPWKVVIGDEAHLIKNRKAKRSRRAASLMARSSYVFLLTGTPLERTPADLWHLMSVLRPELYTSYWRWFNCFVDYDSPYYNPRVKIVKGAKNTELLHDLLFPVYLRRTREEELADLLEPQFISVPVTLHNEQERLYHLFETEGYVAELDKEITNDMARLAFLRQAATDASVFYAGENTKEIPAAKLDAAMDLIEGFAEDEKVVVFSAFRQPAIRFAARFKTGAALFFSEGKSVDVSKLLDEHRILVSTFDSLSMGANLQAARVLVFLDLPWSASTYRQTVGRVYRMGQERQPLIYSIRAIGTVDEYVTQLIEQKNELFNEVMVSNKIIADWGRV